MSAPAHHHRQGHRHAHAARVASVPSASLLRLSAVQRMAGAAALSAVLWLLVWWAMH
jgi:hypothetical protein